MSKYLDAAYAILQDAGGPLTAGDIVKEALKAGLITTKGSTPANTMGSMLYTDIKRGGSRFARHGPGLFVLSGAGARPAPPQDEESGGHVRRRARAIERVRQDDKEIDDASGSDRQRRIGAAGELRVMSELLMRGYNADHITIDSGVDIRAAKDGNVYEIQVKTATELRAGGRYVITIRKKAFERAGGPQLYYVFVLRDRRNGIMCVTISNKEMNTQIKDGNITENEAGYQASFFLRNGSLFLRKENVDRFLNDWSL